MACSLETHFTIHHTSPTTTISRFWPSNPIHSCRLHFTAYFSRLRKPFTTQPKKPINTNQSSTSTQRWIYDLSRHWFPCHCKEPACQCELIVLNLLFSASTAFGEQNIQKPSSDWPCTMFLTLAKDAFLL